MKASDAAGLISAIATLILAIFAVALAGLAFMRGSDVKLFPLSQVVMFEDNRPESGATPLVLLEVAQINRAEGNYGDVVEEQFIEIYANEERVVCFRARAYGDVRYTPQVLAPAPPPPEGAAPPPPEPPRRDPCETQECIHHSVATVLIHSDPLLYGLPPGELVAKRPIFDYAPNSCFENAGAGENPHLNFDQVLDRLSGKTIRVRYISRTWQDGAHAVSCTFQLPTEVADRVRGSGEQPGLRFFARNCID